MNILKKPIVTEKTLASYKADKKVAYEVTLNANKILAAKALENAFGVKVQDVKIINRVGKYKLDRRSRKLNKQKDMKIMIFKLSENDEIDVFNS